MKFKTSSILLMALGLLPMAHANDLTKIASTQTDVSPTQNTGDINAPQVEDAKANQILPPSKREMMALSYIIGNTDEKTFVKAVRLSGQTSGPTTKEVRDAEEKENQKALAWAHEILNGEKDLPVELTVYIRRMSNHWEAPKSLAYNPETELFITEANEPELLHRLNFPRANIDNTNNTNFYGIRIENWNFFGAIPMPPKSAKFISDASVNIYALVRFKPNTLGPPTKTDITNASEITAAAYIRRYRMLGRFGALQATPYKRTATEVEFGKAVDGKSWIGYRGSDGLRICANGETQTFLIMQMTPSGMVHGLSEAPTGHWFIIGNQLLLPDQTLEFELDGDLLRLNGAPLKSDPHLKMRGKTVTYE